MRAFVEPPYGWGPRRMLLVQLERLGYGVDQVGAGEDWLLVLS